MAKYTHKKIEYGWVSIYQDSDGVNLLIEPKNGINPFDHQTEIIESLIPIADELKFDLEKCSIYFVS